MNNDNLLDQINNFSHVYLISTNDLDKALVFANNLSKKIIFSNNDESLNNNEEISYLIDNNKFDDYYLLDSNKSIKVDDLNELFDYFETKSLRLNGNRVYIINGFEKLSVNLSNKLLKFLEEPEDNIYGILITKSIDSILPTIISRCQLINLNYEKDVDIDKLENMQKFINDFCSLGMKLIAYENDYFAIYENNRQDYFECFAIIEKILSTYINYYYKIEYEDVFLNENLSKFSIDKIQSMLKTINNLKRLINNNINLNLLIDRMIIEFERGEQNAKDCWC